MVPVNQEGVKVEKTIATDRWARNRERAERIEKRSYGEIRSPTGENTKRIEQPTQRTEAEKRKD